jgi:hypothetical protein
MAEHMLTEGAPWAILDYKQPPIGGVQGSVRVRAKRAGVAHGIAVWFDSDLYQGIGFSNAPGTSLVYGRYFFPWLEPVSIREGDEISLELSARLIEEFTYGWTTRIGAKTLFTQSTFLGQPLAADWLRRQEPSARPKVGEHARGDAWLLARMDGSRSFTELAAEGVQQGLFRSPDEAFSRARRLARKYPVNTGNSDG